MANSLDPDQDRHSGLGPNCLQRLSVEDKSCPLVRRELNIHVQLSSGATDLDFGLSIQVLTLCVQAGITMDVL